MERLGDFDPQAFSALEPESILTLAFIGLAHLLHQHLFKRARFNSAFGLTPREIQVLAGVARGRTNAETAELLSIAPGTVKKHLDHIYEKLGVGTRTEAVLTALGLLPPGADGGDVTGRSGL
jgi:DNA-binding CsgD family transcriptional regulator